MKVKDKVFLVTGAGGGIGGQLVLGLLDRGAKVAAVDLKEESLQQIKEKAGSNADKVSIHAINITDRAAVSGLPDEVIKQQGQIDGVINCAGIVQPFVKVNDLDFDAIERVMPVPGQSVYGASKAAVKLLTEGLYAELLDTNVRVSVVFPGATNTNITGNSGVKAPSMPTGTKQPDIPMLSAEQAARIILDGVESDKYQIFTGKDSKMMNRLYRLNPKFATKLIAKQMRSLLGGK